METDFSPHDLQWTREQSARFWDFNSRKPGLRYFAADFSGGIVRCVKRAGIRLQGKVLDFGCGRGELLEWMVHHGISCQGAEFSGDSVSYVTNKLGDNHLFLGASQVNGIPTHLPGEEFDIIFCVETIEHVLDDELLPTFQELHRLLRPSGHLVVTTPNEEDLNKSKILCPECGSVFHSVQHVRSWDASSLAAFLNPIGFRKVWCGATVFDNSRFWSFLLRMAFRARSRTMPHLMYVGQKL